MDGSRARAVLGVSEHVSADELRRAFRRVSLVTHPDHGGDADAFTEALTAFRVLEATARAPRPVALPTIVAAHAGFDSYDTPRVARPPTAATAAAAMPDFASVLHAVMAQAAA